MAEVKEENYILVPGWAVKNLNLKGTELLVFSIIHGFSQDGEHTYHGGRKYLVDWTNSSIATVQRALDSLVEKGLIKKGETFTNGVKFCDYQIDMGSIKMNQGSIKMTLDQVQNDTRGSIKMTHNNKDNNKLNKNNNKDIVEIIDYLNEICGTRYQAASKDTQTHINARLKEGFKVEDFKTVIDKKNNEWGDDPKMSSYLRPSTLFGSKFESYLNQKGTNGYGSNRGNTKQNQSRASYDLDCTEAMLRELENL